MMLSVFQHAAQLAQFIEQSRTAMCLGRAHDVRDPVFDPVPVDSHAMVTIPRLAATQLLRLLVERIGVLQEKIDLALRQLERSGLLWHGDLPNVGDVGGRKLVRRQQCHRLVARMAEHVRQVAQRIDLVHFTALDEAVVNRRGVARAVNRRARLTSARRPNLTGKNVISR